MSVFMLTLQYVFIDLFGGLVRWPVWWYSKGLLLTLKWAKNAIMRYAQTVGVIVWIKNMFVPMYGLRDWQGRMISFLVRLVQIVFRSLFLCFYSLLILVLLAVYVAAPVAVAIEILYHLTGSFL